MLVPPGDPAALAAALRRWLAEPDLRDRIRKNALVRRKTLTGWAATAKLVADALSTVATHESAGTMTEILTPETALAAMPLVSPTWLGVREAVDAAARSADLVARLRRRFRTGPLEIHDLGCGTGSMARWLAPLLPGPQHWVLYDRDPDLLLGHVPASRTAVDDPAARHQPADRRRPRRRRPGDRLGALLDLLTADEVDAIAAACAGAGAPRCS